MKGLRVKFKEKCLFQRVIKRKGNLIKTLEVKLRERKHGAKR